MDDYLESFDTVEEALLHQAQLVNTVSSYGLNLRKWNSNAECFKHDEMIQIKTHPNELCTALGMQWDTANDQISYKIGLKKENTKITKRNVLSEIASLFDPLGLLAPVVMQAKIFMQQLWLMKIGWDEELPPEAKKIGEISKQRCYDVQNVGCHDGWVIQMTTNTYHCTVFVTHPNRCIRPDVIYVPYRQMDPLK